MMIEHVPAVAPVVAPSGFELQRALADLAAKTARDPVAFTVAAYRWGEADLAGHTGPLEWQAEILTQIRDGLLTVDQAIRLAVSSGNGIGKSTLVSFIVIWAICTSPDARVVVTANTAAQLAGKTWPEVTRWLRRCVFRGWFTATATSIFSADPAHERTWRADTVAWNEGNPEAFAGLHNAGGRIVVIFDEASAIPSIIWETVEGAMTDADTQIIWAVFGNPTRSSGPFFECFHRFGHRWHHRRIDSRTVPITNKAQLTAWIADHGLDSDFVRMRVTGLFPRAGSMQFIPSDLAEAARTRDAPGYPHEPLIVGVDVARQGGDQTVIAFRRGRDARSIAMVKLRVPDLMAIAAKVHDLATVYRADAVFVDGGGVGAGVVDRLRQLRLAGVIEVQFGAKADRGDIDQTGAVARAGNKRTELWNTMREWLRGGGIPDDSELIADLTGVEFGHDSQDRIVLERKDDMRRRGLSSPDCGDALALTFAYPVSPPAPFAPSRSREQRQYDPHAWLDLPEREHSSW